MVADALLASWRDTPARRAIIDFVSRVTDDGGAGYVDPADRVAVFDNDGTLWTEKPIPIQLDLPHPVPVWRSWPTRTPSPGGPGSPTRPRSSATTAWLGDAMVKHLPAATTRTSGC